MLGCLSSFTINLNNMKQDSYCNKPFKGRLRRWAAFLNKWELFELQKKSGCQD